MFLIHQRDVSVHAQLVPWLWTFVKENVFVNWMEPVAIGTAHLVMTKRQRNKKGPIQSPNTYYDPCAPTRPNPLKFPLLELIELIH